MNIIKKIDFEWFSFLAILFLITSSLVTIYSLSLSGDEGGLSIFHKQLIFFGVSLPFFIFFSFFDHKNLKFYSGLLYIISLILLTLVLFWGKSVRGTSGWFDLGFLNFQPVEVVKIFVIIILAKYFSKRIKEVTTFKQIIVSLFYISIPVFLTIQQPDFGSAVVILVIWLGMLMLTNINKKTIALILLFLAAFSFLNWNFFLKDYQKERIKIFFNPQADALGSGYNIIQSMVAVGSGGIKGKGLGYGSQSQLNFLPEKHNDFIFAVIAEENGFWGALIIIFIYGFLFYRMGIIARESRNYFGWFLANGIIIMFFFHTVINIGMNIGVVPIAGLSLPFLSYGGSFILISMIAFGIVQNIWKNRKKGKFDLKVEER